MSKRALRIASFVLPVGILGLLLTQVQAQDVVALVVEARPVWLLVGLGAYIFTNLLRGGRMARLLGWPWHRAAALMPLMFALSMFNNVLPSRTGELSFPMLITRRHRVDAGQAAGLLVVARLFDYLAVVVLFVLVALAQPQAVSGAGQAFLWAVAGLASVGVLILVTLPWLGQRGVALVDWGLRRVGLRRSAFGAALHRLTQTAALALTRIKEPAVVVPVMAWSLAIWLGTFGWFGCFLAGLGLSVSPGATILGATFAVLSKAVPFISIGGFGAHEAGWTVGFTLVGMETGTAVASGLAVNVLTMLASVLCGLPSLLVTLRRADGPSHREVSAP